MTVTREFADAYEEVIRALGSDPSSADVVVRRGLEFYREEESAHWSPNAPVDILKRLIRTRALYAVLLAHAVGVKDRMLSVEARLREETSLTPQLEAEFRRLQAEAAKRDPSLLDLRPPRSDAV